MPSGHWDSAAKDGERPASQRSLPSKAGRPIGAQSGKDTTRPSEVLGLVIIINLRIRTGLIALVGPQQRRKGRQLTPALQQLCLAGVSQTNRLNEVSTRIGVIQRQAREATVNQAVEG